MFALKSSNYILWYYYILYFYIPQRNQLTRAIHHHVDQALFVALEEQEHRASANLVFTATLTQDADQSVSPILIVQLHEHVYGPIVAILVKVLAA